jgi:hypothetical protein
MNLFEVHGTGQFPTKRDDAPQIARGQLVSWDMDYLSRVDVRSPTQGVDGVHQDHALADAARAGQNDERLRQRPGSDIHPSLRAVSQINVAAALEEAVRRSTHRGVFQKVGGTATPAFQKGG